MTFPRWLPLALVLLVALALRVALWDNLPRQGLISDEAEYLAAADWLAQGRDFTWHQGWLWTRAPLYPLFLAAHMRLFGFDLAPIFVSQTGLSLLNVALVYLLARQVVGDRLPGAAALAALLAALYLPFAVYPQLVLGETLYLTLLLGAFFLLGRWSAHPAGRGVWLLLAGVLLGLATLTRGLTLGCVPLVAGWAWFGTRRHREGRGARSLAAPALLLLLCAATVLPWSLHASRLYGGPVVVDTTGAFNLMLGARTAYDGERRDAPTRNFVLALLDTRLLPPERAALLAESCLMQQQDARLLTALERSPSDIPQAERQALMTAEGLCLLRAAPGAFVHKSLTELVDLFTINYTGSERLSGGFSLGRLPPWYTLALFALDDTLYVLLLPLAVLGWAGARHTLPAVGRALTLLVGLWWLYNLLTAPLLFAINRFRVPLLPFACIYAACLLVWLLTRRLNLPAPRWLLPYGVLALLLALLAWSPYAYLQDPPASWASYLGPYPSSLQNTRIAWEQRATYLREQQVIDALGRGADAEARALIAAGGVPTRTLRLALPLLEGLERQPAMGLELLDPSVRQANPDLLPLNATAIISQTKDWEASVVRGDLLRRLGDEAGARAAFTPTFVDDQNPVEWGWRWLYPAPTSRIDLGGNLDIGYIRGFYLGEGDQTTAGDGTFRWSADEAWLLFPAQGSGTSRQICLRADGRGWPQDLALPTFDLLLATAAPEPLLVDTLQLRRGVAVYCTELPPVPPGADVVVLLRTPTFVPAAADLLAQQGPQVGQLRRLGLRLDWVELGEPQP